LIVDAQVAAARGAERKQDGLLDEIDQVVDRIPQQNARWASVD
jgi:hypothetical protein